MKRFTRYFKIFMTLLVTFGAIYYAFFVVPLSLLERFGVFVMQSPLLILWYYSIWSKYNPNLKRGPGT